MTAQKQAVAIHDISGFGRCSLTVALPLLSAAGIQTSVIPTAVLSTHTGGFSGYTYRDLSDDILPTAKHWKEQGFRFDAIYTGFLGSIEQIDIVIETLRLIRGKNTLTIVDPVMADFGRLYTIFSSGFPKAMRKLCAEADVIVPNITEAALLTDTPYREGPFERGEVERMLRSLTEIGPVRAVLTGVTYADDPGKVGAASYDSASGEFAYAFEDRVDMMYHGTGDVFASVLTAALIKGKTLPESCTAAVRFTVDAIRRTRAEGTDNRFGVDFENGMADLPGIIGGK